MTSLIIERFYDAPPASVWRAITDKSEMKHWYFDLAEFKAEVGFEFQFWAGEEGKQYLHRCQITEVVPCKKISYTWRYDGYEGVSWVTFTLTAAGDQTKLTLTHHGIEHFPASNPDFAAGNFAKGWTHILDVSLRDHLELQPEISKIFPY